MITPVSRRRAGRRAAHLNVPARPRRRGELSRKRALTDPNRWDHPAEPKAGES